MITKTTKTTKNNKEQDDTPIELILFIVVVFIGAMFSAMVLVFSMCQAVGMMLHPTP